MRKLVSFLVILLFAAPALALAQDNPLGKLTDEDLAKYRIQRSDEGSPTETPDEAGLRFLDDLKARDPEVYTVAKNAFAYQHQSEESQKFARHNRFVLVAYGVIWAILAVFSGAVFLRQRRLKSQIADLEARLSESEGGR